MEHDFKHLHVEFFMDKKLNKRKSEEAGAKIFDDVEKVKIRIAGDTKSTHVAPAHDQSSVYGPNNRRLTYAELHEGPYQAFKNGLDAAVQGTPIGLLPTLTPAKEASLKASNVVTVEQLAELDGSFLQKLGMGSRELKTIAIEFLDNQSRRSDTKAISDENEELKKRIAALEEMMEAQTAPAATPAPSKPVDDVIEDNPFETWDKGAIQAWMDDSGGKFDARWSEERARIEAFKHNEKITAEEEAA